MDANAPENCDRITPYLYEGVAATMDWIPGRSVRASAMSCRQT